MRFGTYGGRGFRGSMEEEEVENFLDEDDLELYSANEFPAWT